MNRLLFLLLASFLFLNAVPAPRPAIRPGKDRAVFFAVEKYQNSKLTNLQNPVKNARDIAEELKKRFGFETEVLENPTREQIIGKFDELTRLYARNEDGQHPSDGQLFLFFSGHGMSEDENGYFLPADADPAKPYDKGIAYEIWRPKIDKINCRHILVAIDACYSVRFDPDWKNRTDGQFKRPGELTDAQKALANYEQYTARVFFTSDTKEDKTPDRSNFAQKLLEGLRTANTTDGFLTSKQLFANYVEGATPTPRAGTFGSDEPSSAFLFYDQAPFSTASNDSDQITWRSVQRQNTPEAYAYYLEAFPSGYYRAQALDERSWLLAVRQNTTAAYQVYLDTNPQGHHRADAQEKIPSKHSLKMVLITGGSFTIGCKNGRDSNCYDWEKPAHNVTLPSYYLSQTEVTNKEFCLFLNEKGNSLDGGGPWIDLRGVHGNEKCRIYLAGTVFKVEEGYENHPVIFVSWLAATAYCKWFGEKSGKDYRLPTEAEWEYAARGGNRSRGYIYSGSNSLDEVAWNSGNSGFKTHPVGSKKENELGLYDMSGNVWEWCIDDWYTSFNGAPTDGKAWLNHGAYRVIRGGGWGVYGQGCRVSHRAGYTPEVCRFDVGFRLALNE
jgi:formylglycine-generating enzyme required for sulfatase activity